MPIEQVAAGLERIVAADREVEWLGAGYGGVDERGRLTGVAEGPVWWQAGGWWKDGGYLHLQRYRRQPADAMDPGQRSDDR